MKSLYIASILSILLFLSKNQKPDNCTIYQIGCNSNDCSYEYKFQKGEIFGFEFSKGRGIPCYWELLNQTNFNEHNSIQFIKSYIYDYNIKKYYRALDEETDTEETELFPEIEVEDIKVMDDIYGGSEFYYEIFKALHAANSQTLKYIYTCWDQDIIEKVSINISVCDEIHEEKCIININCSDIESPSKKNCENFITSNEDSKCVFDENNNACIEKKICSLVAIEPEINCEKASTLNIKTKCIYDEDNKRCKEEEKKCLEIDGGATEEICADATTTEEKKICLLDEKTNSCKEEIKKDDKEEEEIKKDSKEEEEIKKDVKEEEENKKDVKEEEVIKKDGGKNNKFSFILLIILLIFLY